MIDAWLARPATFGQPAKELTGLAAFVEQVKPVLPIPALLVVCAALYYLFFKNTWRELDEEAHRHRADVLAQGTMDRRPFVALVICALVLTMQEYYGGRSYFDASVRQLLTAIEPRHAWLKLQKYDELWGFVWWSSTRVLGYVLPFALWKLFFPKDSLLDFGLRTKGFLRHAWIYGLFAAAVIPSMLVVAKNPDFGAYYPFYKTSTRSWFDFLAWEAMYFAQFFALEMFFRGFWLGALRKSFGSGAIFVMAVPYCMIHYGKPYLEAAGAIIAGIALGSISMKTKSIYSGFLLHITVAVMMDWLSLRNRHATPLYLWPPDPTSAIDPAAEAAAREALAVTVERTAGVAFLALAVLVVALALKDRRDRALAT